MHSQKLSHPPALTLRFPYEVEVRAGLPVGLSSEKWPLTACAVSFRELYYLPTLQLTFQMKVTHGMNAVPAVTQTGDEHDLQQANMPRSHTGDYTLHAESTKATKRWISVITNTGESGEACKDYKNIPTGLDSTVHFISTARGSLHNAFNT